MEVSAEVSVVSATAGFPRRSFSKRPVSSAARCCASAAEPPLPQTKSRWPDAKVSRINAIASSNLGASAATRSTASRCYCNTRRRSSSVMDASPLGSCIAAPSCLALATFDDARGRVALHEYQDHHLAAVFGDAAMTLDLFGPVIAALHEITRPRSADETLGRVFRKRHDPVHAFQRREHGHALIERVHGPRRALQAPHGRV